MAERDQPPVQLQCRAGRPDTQEIERNDNALQEPLLNSRRSGAGRQIVKHS